MGANTKIEWAHHTFNPWWGCVRVSPACQHCYAEAFSKRIGQTVWGVDAERRFFGDAHWNEPLKWDRQAREAGARHRVFCASMADVFEVHTDRRVHAEMQVARHRLWRLIEATPHLDWMLLTKRPENITTLTPGDWDQARRNVWFGTTVEDAPRLGRIDVLRAVPAYVRFLSCEPLLAEIHPPLHGIDLVICGGESGPGARPMRAEWARALRDECEAQGKAFHFKQWGDYDEHGRKVGKAAAGRLLDGREWNQMPELREA